MRVTVNALGRSVDIETDEDGMSTHRLANIAVATWRRTGPDGSEDMGPAYGFTSQINTPWRGYRRFGCGSAPMDGS